MTDRFTAARALSTHSLIFAIVATLGACARGSHADLVVQRSPQIVVAAPSDDSLRAASGCSGCPVLVRSGSVILPLSGRRYVEAKLASSDGSRSASVAYDEATGTIVNPVSLQHDESVARYARQGRLSDELYAASQASSPGTVPVWIWTDVKDDPPPKTQLLHDSAARASYEAQRLAGLKAAAGPILAWLDGHGYTTHDRGVNTPNISADVPATALAELGRLQGLAQAGYRHPSEPTANYWFDTVKTTAAHASTGNASGIPFCNLDGQSVDDMTYLTNSGEFNPYTPPGSHIRWTSELIAGSGTYSMAPLSSFYVGDYIAASQTLSQLLNWCYTNNVSGENYSAGFNPPNDPPGPLTVSDMDFDYLVKHYPYPIITASAGNSNSSGQDTVSNRGYNFLVVGGDDDQSSTATSNDVMYSSSSWRNPVTTHNDFELPNLVAPAVSVSSNSTIGSGTSASAPITLGAALLAMKANSILNGWPEMMRAVVMATATHPIDPGPNPGNAARTTGLPSASGDLKQGAGLLNASALLYLAQPASNLGPGSTGYAQGYNAAYYTFATDFNGFGQSNDIYNISIPSSYGSGYRLRVVMVWDSTASGGCPISSPPGDCTADTIDADLDLHVVRSSDGAYWNSSTYDSSWEMVDFPVNGGDNFTARFIKYATNATSTYIGIAWYTYNPANE